METKKIWVDPWVVTQWHGVVHFPVEPFKGEGSQKLAKVQGELVAETEKAILLRMQGIGLIGKGKTYEKWIPKSQIWGEWR